MRPLSQVAPAWWDYTTLDRAILDDAARLTADDLLGLSRPGFTIKFYDTVQEFYLAEALEYITAWQQATPEKPAETGMSEGQQRALVIGGSLAALALLALAIWVALILVRNPVQAAAVRDVFIIFMALESMVIGVALIVLMVQVAVLTNLLRQFVTDKGRILPRKYTGLPAHYQRQLNRAIKRARQMLLMS